MIGQAKQYNQELDREHILKNSFTGYAEDVKAKIKCAEDAGVKKMVIVVRGGRSIKEPMKLFHELM
jgi:hypothetical protein